MTPEDKKTAKKKRIIAAYRVARERMVRGFLGEIGEALENSKGVVDDILLPDDIMDSFLHKLLRRACVEAVEMNLDEGATGNICTMLYHMREVYDPDDLLQTLLEGLKDGIEKYGYSPNMSHFIKEVSETLDMPAEKVKKLLVATLI